MNGAVTSKRSLLLSGRWIAGHLLALTLVVLFVNFGFWQVRRLNQSRELAATIEARAAMPAERPATILGEGGEFEHRPAVANGRYVPEEEVLLRGRSLDGQPGFHVLTPLVLGEEEGEFAGKALLVERGWVPYDMDSVPVSAALPPAGPVTVEGELHPPQSPPTGALAGLAARDPAEGELTQSFYVDVERLQPQMEWELVPAYLTLRGQSPASTGGLPRALPPAAYDHAPHLGYAIQWFSFALIGVVGYWFLLRSVTRRS